MEKPCNPFGSDCVHFEHNGKLISLKDPKSKGAKREIKYEASNSQQKNLVCLRFGDCLKKNALGRKCDYLLLDCQDRAAHFIEMKGESGLADAVEQISNSFHLTKDELFSSGFKTFFAKIVLSRTPNILPSNWRGFLNLIEKQHHGKVVYKSSPFNDII